MTQLIAALLIAVASFVGGWTVNQWRIDSHDAKQELAAVRFQTTQDIRRLDNALEAQAKAVERERLLRADVAALRDSVVSLSGASGEALRAARTDHEACIDRTLAFADVFQGCTARLSEVVEKADHHVNDIRTLIETAWPE